MQKYKIIKKLREGVWGWGKMAEYEVEVPETGHTTTFVRREASDVATIIPFIDDATVVMVRQYRFGSDSITLEFPKGMTDGQPPEEAAVRELSEETGYEAARIDKIGSVIVSPSWNSQAEHVFTAHNLTEGAQHTEETEIIEIEHIELSSIPKRIREGEINDAGTVAAYQLLQLSRE